MTNMKSNKHQLPQLYNMLLNVVVCVPAEVLSVQIDEILIAG